MATNVAPASVSDPGPRRAQFLRRRYTSSPQRMLLAARLTLIANIGIMLSGALVRVSGSGLGCSDWPRCSTESIVPNEAHAPTLIEFGNRMLTFAVTATALFAIFSALTLAVYRRELLWISVGLLGGVFAQAIIGGISVLADLDWVFISAHYMVSLLLLVVPSAVLTWKAGRDTRTPRQHLAADALTARVVFALLPIGALALWAGTLATAAGPNSGGAATGDVVERFDVHGTGTLEWIVQRHGAIAAIFGISIIVAWSVAKWRRAGERLSLVLTVAGMLVAVQGMLGLIQYGLELPGGLVWIHVTLATLTWATVVWAWLLAGSAKRFAGVGAPAPRAAPAD